MDVGQADATLIISDNQAMLIDGGNTSDSSLIYSYLKEHDVHKLDYIICTHVHEDHIGGLSGALNYAEVKKVYCPVENYNSDSFYNLKKYIDKQNLEIEVPNVGTKFDLGDAKCEILSVNTLANGSPNNSSIITKIRLGFHTFLFSGDAEQVVEEKIIESGKNINCTVLKVPHHGSEKSLSDDWLKKSNPKYAVISVEEENTYGHPSKAVLEKLKENGVVTYRTDIQGHIICKSDGKNITFSVEKNKNIDTLVIEEKENKSEFAGEYAYVLNTSSMKIHYGYCESVSKIKDKNKKYTTLDRETLIFQGYSPCGICKP